MVVNKTSEYDKNAKEALMMDFKTTEELDSLAGRRFDDSFSYFITKARPCNIQRFL